MSKLSWGPAAVAALLTVPPASAEAAPRTFRGLACGSGPSAATAVLIGGMGDSWRSLDGWADRHASAGRRVCGYDYDSCRQSMSEAAGGLEKELAGLAAGGTRDLSVTAYSMGGWIGKAALDSMAASGSIHRYDRVELVTLGTPWGGFSRGNLSWRLRGFPTPGAARGLARMIHRPMAFEIGAKSEFVRARRAALPEDVRFAIYDGGADRVAAPRTREERDNYAAVLGVATDRVSIGGATHDDLRDAAIVPAVEETGPADPGPPRPGDRVRIESPDRQRTRVAVVSRIGPDGIGLVDWKHDRAGVPLIVPWESVGRLEVSRGHKSMAGRGAAIGAIAAGAPMLLWAMATCGSGECEYAGLVIGYMGGVGAGVGALVGLAMRSNDWVLWDHTGRSSRLRLGLTPARRGAGVGLSWEFGEGRRRR